MKILIASVLIFLLSVIRGKIGHAARPQIFSTLIMSVLFVAFIVFIVLTKVPIENQGP